MKIIKAKSEHFSLMEDLIHQVWKPTFIHKIDYQQLLHMENNLYTSEAFRQQSEEGHSFLIAIDGEQLLGLSSYLTIDDGLRIPKLYVHPKAHRQGVGTALLNALKSIAIQEDKAYLELNINRYNDALYFYRRYGFYIKKSVDIQLGEFYLNDYVLRYTL